MSDHAPSELVSRQTADGWTLYAPGTTDDCIAAGSPAPPRGMGQPCSAAHHPRRHRQNFQVGRFLTARELADAAMMIVSRIVR